MSTPAFDARLLEALLPPQLAEELRRPEPPDAAMTEACEALEASLRALVPFVPAPVVDLQLARRGPGRIAGIYLTGTIVYIEVSGFAALSSQLTVHGRRGTEELSAIVNQLSSALIREIYAFGGGLVKFGGESFTALFDKNKLEQSHAACACAAALAIQARFAERAAAYTGGDASLLGVRIAVHSGRAFAVEIGDTVQSHLVVTGRAVHRAVGLLEVAAGGEIIISEDTLQEIGPAQVAPKLGGLYVLQSLNTTPPQPEVHDPVWRPGPPSLDMLRLLTERFAALRPYVQRHIPARYLHDATGHGEFRPVTVLFAKFYAFSNLLNLLELPALVEGDMSIIGQVLNAYYARTHTVIERFGGSVNKIDMATFGDRLMALFGAPVAHEDDPDRAIQAALALRDALDDTRRAIREVIEDWTGQHPEQRALLYVGVGPLRQRVGVASGTVFAGIVGATQRREYTIIGEAVQRATRLLDTAADGEVLIDAPTRRTMTLVVEAEPLPIQPPGATPVTYRILGQRSGGLGADEGRAVAPLIGRHTELVQLLAFAEAVGRRESSVGRIVALVGDLGTGKTRLVDEALRRVRSTMPAMPVVRVTCRSYERHLPYAAIGRLLPRLLGYQPAGRPLDLVRQIEQLAPEWSRFAPLLNPLLDLALPETDLTRALAPEQRQDRLDELVVQLCLAIADQTPLVMVIDDLQLADASSFALLARLAVRLASRPLLLLLVYAHTPDVAEPWRTLKHATVISLGELDRAESEALLGTLLGGVLPDGLRPAIERAVGNPLFIEETVRYLQESGALQRGPSGAWALREPADTVIPTQLEQLIVTRFDRLTDDAREVLHVAAVIGERFPARLLTIVAKPIDLLARPLAELVEAAILVIDETTGEPAYRFKHPLVRDVAYGSMLYARRRKLHARVASAIRQVYAGSLDNHRAVLAQHELGAGRPLQAYEHLVIAGRDAQVRYANREALALYSQALAIERTRPGGPRDYQASAELYENLADVLARTGDHAGARQHYQELLALLDDSASDDRAVLRAALQRKIGGTHEREGNLDAALPWYVRAAESVIATGSTPQAALEHARLLSDTGWLHFRRNELDQAQRDLEWALSLVVPLAAYDEQARVQNRLGGIAWARGDLARARHYVEQSLRAHERAGDLSGQASALNNLGILSSHLGQIDDAIRYGRQALAINMRIGDRRELSIAAITTGYALYDGERSDEATLYFSQAFEHAVEVRDTYLQMMALLGRSCALLELQRWDEAEQVARQCQDIAQQLDMPTVHLEGFVVLGEAALRRGDLPAALRALEAGRALHVDEAGEEFARFLRLDARVALAQGDEYRAIDLLELTETLFIRLHNAPEVDRTRRLLDELAVHRGRT